ncbi:cytochrome b [Muricoccus radiodurans]|uniref:cytochrome b n=1 Tax=Muricoccus radiodurans TaxID=2231721 RepID=UPI003CEEBC0B
MRYNAVARMLHWLTVALILTTILLGLVMVWVELPDPTKFTIYDIHQSIGVTLLLITLFRLVWRAGHPPPPLDPSIPPFMAFGAHASHFGLYALLIAMPVTGFLATNAWGFPLHLWWLVHLPDPIGRSERWAPILSLAHDTMGFALIGLVALHAGAALFHHFIRRDDTLRRML